MTDSIIWVVRQVLVLVGRGAVSREEIQHTRSLAEFLSYWPHVGF